MTCWFQCTVRLCLNGTFYLFTNPLNSSQSYCTLETLDLSVNEFTSDVYFGIGRFHNLTVLNLRKNSFTGVLPSSIARLTNLKKVDVGLNIKLGGPIVMYGVSWHNLEYLDISETLASGTIPSEIGLLSQLEVLRLLDVAISGTVPSEIGLLEPLSTYIYMEGSCSRGVYCQLKPLTLFFFSTVFLHRDSSFGQVQPLWKCPRRNWNAQQSGNV